MNKNRDQLFVITLNMLAQFLSFLSKIFSMEPRQLVVNNHRKHKAFAEQSSRIRWGIFISIYLAIWAAAM